MDVLNYFYQRRCAEQFLEKQDVSSIQKSSTLAMDLLPEGVVVVTKDAACKQVYTNKNLKNFFNEEEIIDEQIGATTVRADGRSKW